MSASYTYHYEPLANPSQQIRLLQLDAARDTGAVLTGSLSVYKIPSRDGTRLARLGRHLQLPGYFAISYVWGTGPDLQRSHEIILDNRRYPITANLYAALHKYRSSGPDSRRYWVDAICINQADDAEKSAQVPLMRDIYHLAMAVFVWLGDETAEITRLQLFIYNLVNESYYGVLRNLGNELADTETKAQDMGKRRQPLTQFIHNESKRLLVKGANKSILGVLKGAQLSIEVANNSLGAHLFDEGVQEGIGITSMEEIKSWSPNKKQLKLVQDEDFQEIATLLDKVLFSESTYFNRMWTLQEICVANCGLVKILGVQLTDFLSLIYYLQRNFNIRPLTFEKIATIFEINSKFNSGQRQTLRILLALSAGRKSENPRDRVYGLHGLMKDDQTPLLKPDYTMSVEEVYADVTRHIISTEKSLDVVCGHQLNDRLPELPSWVPDIRHFGLETNSLVQASGENTIYQASLSEQHALPQHPFQLPQHWHTVTVTGIFLGNVSVLSDISMSGQELQKEAFALSERLWSAALVQHQEWTPEEVQIINKVSDLVAMYAEFYQNSDRATFWTRNLDKLRQLRAIIGNINDQNSCEPSLSCKYFLTLLCGRIATGARCSEEMLSEHWIRSCIPDQEGVETLERLCKALDAGTRSRRLIMSEGKKLGAAAEQTQKGDMIYVLMGCSVPVVLRKTARPSEFQFVGECYWHGFMDGEALAMRDGDKVTAHEFKLV